MTALRRAVALVGFGLGAVGAALDRSPVVWAAIALLGVALALRLAAGIRERRAAPASDSVSASQDD